jgi:uncharacterized protein YjcR
MKSTAKRELARLLYIQHPEMLLKDIAARLEVSPNTVTNWRKKDNWDLHRDLQQKTRHEQLRTMWEELAAMNKAIHDREASPFATKAEADARSQLRKDIKELQGGLTPVDAMAVFKGFLEWLAQLDADKAKEFVELQNAYLITLEQ